MSKPVLTGKKNYHQGKFVPKHPEKYIGNPTNIVYRSGWERSFLQWCDMSQFVLKYGSEELVIPYCMPDGSVHRYFMDFICYIKQKDGSVQKFAVEIKPYKETHPPKKQRVITESYKYQVETWIKNEAKWKAADAFCKRMNMKFIILTERELFKK